MVLFCFPLILVFSFLLSVTSSLICPSWFKREGGESVIKAFHRLVNLVLTTSDVNAKDPVTTEYFQNERTGSANETTVAAARILMSLALANGLVTLSPGAGIAPSITTLVNSFANASLAQITTGLAACFSHEMHSGLAEQYEKILDTSKNPIRAMSLAIEAITRDFKESQTVSAQPKMKNPTLGCKFDDDEYSYSRSIFNVKNPSPKPLPKYWKSDIPRMEFDSNESFEQFRDVLVQIYSSVLANTRYNDVDEWIRLDVVFVMSSIYSRFIS